MGHSVEILDREVLGRPHWEGDFWVKTYQHIASRGRRKVERRQEKTPETKACWLLPDTEKIAVWLERMKWIVGNEVNEVVDGRWHRAYRSLQGSGLYPEQEGTLEGLGQSSNWSQERQRWARKLLRKSRQMIIRTWIRVMAERIGGTGLVLYIFWNESQ